VNIRILKPIAKKKTTKNLVYNGLMVKIILFGYNFK